MSALSDLMLRIVIDANYQTKGATLTWEELDGNFKLIADVIRELNIITPSGIDAYNPATEYSLGDLVTHTSNLWEYVHPTPSTGNAPALASAFWAIRSAGTLSHAQNTDSHTNKNRFGIGDGEAVLDKEIFVRNGSADNAEPRLRYNRAVAKWEISHDGVTFSGIGYSGPEIVDTTSLVQDTVLDMRGRAFCVFVGSDPYTNGGAPASLDIPNPGGKAVFIFTIDAGKVLDLPEASKSADALYDSVAKTWTPLETGTYKAEFTWDGTTFFVDFSPSKYQ